MFKNLLVHTPSERLISPVVDGAVLAGDGERRASGCHLDRL